MAKTVSLSIFVACGLDHPKSGIFHIGNNLFELRCFAGVVEFEPDLISLPLQQILDRLDRYGLQGIHVEPF